MKVGDLFRIRDAELLTIKDPETGATLAKFHHLKAEVVCQEVHERIAMCSTNNNPRETGFSHGLLRSAAQIGPFARLMMPPRTLPTTDFAIGDLAIPAAEDRAAEELGGETE